MRLVPKYLIIGSGRMANHFSHYLKFLNIPFQQWSRAYNSTKELVKYSKICSHALLLIKDNAIENFVYDNNFLLAKCCVHFSGRLVAKDFFSAHPLMTFGNDLYDLNTYQSVPFVLEKEGPDLDSLLPGLPNKEYKIPRALKALYHALIVMGNNFSTILWQHVLQRLSDDLHLPQEIIYPILKQTTMNFLQQPQNALTGPLVRNDQETIQAHLQALQDDVYKEIYQIFLEVFAKTEK